MEAAAGSENNGTQFLEHSVESEVMRPTLGDSKNHRHVVAKQKDSASMGSEITHKMATGGPNSPGLENVNSFSVRKLGRPEK